MEIRLELPDYFKSLVGSKSLAELSVLMQMVLLNPSILSSIKGLEVDSVLTLEYLAQILAAVEKAPRVITQVASPAAATQPTVPTDVDLSILDQFNTESDDEDSNDENDDDPFKGLADFLGG